MIIKKKSVRTKKTVTKKTKKKLYLTAILERDANGYLAICPEFDLPSRGKTVQQALSHLKKEVGNFLKKSSPAKIHKCIHNEILITRFEMTYRE